LYCPNWQVRVYFAGWQKKIAAPGRYPPRGKNQRKLFGLLKDQPTFGDLIAFLLDEDPNMSGNYASWTVWNMVNNGILQEQKG